MNPMDYLLDMFDTLLSWVSTGLRQTTQSYCVLETAEDQHTLVANDGSLLTIVRMQGVNGLVGDPEFERLHLGICQSLMTSFSRLGHSVQCVFSYDKEAVREELQNILLPARQTAKHLNLALDDLLDEREENLSTYCGHETVFFVLWTRPYLLTNDQIKSSLREKQKKMKEFDIPPFQNTQNLIAAIPDLKNAHDSFVRAFYNDLTGLGLQLNILPVHEALRQVRMSIDSGFTDKHWSPRLPGDKIPERALDRFPYDISNVMYPTLSDQLFVRDAERIDLRTVRIGDRIYSSVFIYLFPKEVQSFMSLLRRTLPTHIPWRISFLIESKGITNVTKFKKTVAAILSFSSSQNRLLHDSINQLQEIELNSDDAVVRLRVAAVTWAPADEPRLLRTRASQLAKAIQGWGTCDVTEVSGDPFSGAASSMLAVTGSSDAVATLAPLSEVVYMLPFTRPASQWRVGAVLFRSPDGKPWPYHPGSTQQTTWIDLIYARPGSGKSVLSNAINLALCLSSGLKRLPRIAIVDIGPSSSGLISLIREALPKENQHWVQYHRLRMTPEYAINPFDTQLGCRYPMPQDRSFLVNFLTLLVTPLGAENPYDAMADMAGMVIDELYKSLAEGGNPYTYTPGLELIVDSILEEMDFVRDTHTTWWEVTDALFLAGFSHEAQLAQRHAMPLLADAASICRTHAVVDLFGEIKAPTGESLIDSFSRMVSGAVREYPILSRITQFDLGDARIVSLDLDEVARIGGAAADRQTGVMYMLARQVTARHFYLTEASVADMPEAYRQYHHQRISEIREDPKRLIYDEFHRTAKTRAIREQVLVDMREGRKWKVQVGLISQSIDDFDPVMVEFATSVFIMDAGPQQAVKRTAEIFGLSETAQIALTRRVHGPREGGATFLAQFSTKSGMNTQLLTATLGPVELWAFSTTAEDAKLRQILYSRLGPDKARKVLAQIFPTGTATHWLEARMENLRVEMGNVTPQETEGVIEELVTLILEEYSKNPQVRLLPV